MARRSRNKSPLTRLFKQMERAGHRAWEKLAEGADKGWNEYVSDATPQHARRSKKKHAAQTKFRRAQKKAAKDIGRGGARGKRATKQWGPGAYQHVRGYVRED